MYPDIQAVIAAVRHAHPAVRVEPVQVLHPGSDDDGIWYFRHPAASGSVQIESSTGQAPFLIEDDQDPPVWAADVDAAVAEIGRRLGRISVPARGPLRYPSA